MSDDLTESERRAFYFGPKMRRLAEQHCGGRLEEAHTRFSNPERVAQHVSDLAAIRPERRFDFIILIGKAGGGEEDLDPKSWS